MKKKNAFKRTLSIEFNLWNEKDNPIGPSGGTSIGNALKHNTSLSELNLESVLYIILY